MKRPKNDTFRGYRNPSSIETVEDDADGSARTSRTSQAPERPSRVGTPLVEIEVVHAVGSAPRELEDRRVLEVWTKNRIYVLDPLMICVAVLDRVTEKSDSSHAFLGLRLVGGQSQDGGAIEISYPFPRPGTEAVFEKSDGRRASFSRTSTVTRVVLRLQIVTVSHTHVVPTWEEIRGLLRPPPEGANQK